MPYLRTHTAIDAVRSAIDNLKVNWMSWGTATFGAFAVLLAIVGMFAFRRDMLILYLQE